MTRETFIEFGKTHDHSIDFLLGIIKDARITTLKRIREISTEELHWQVADGWNTVGALLAHIIGAGHYFRTHFIHRKQWTAEEEERWRPGLEMGKYIPQLITNEPVETYLKQLEEINLLIVESIKELSVEEFHKKREGYNPETGNNLAWVLYHLAEDEVHHRGQMSIIRKLYKLRTEGTKISK